MLAHDLDHPLHYAPYLGAARRMGAGLLSFDGKPLQLAERLGIARGMA